MTTDWNLIFQNLPSKELDKIALLRVIECTNGIIQLSFKENHPNAPSLIETTKSKRYASKSVKGGEISLKAKTGKEKVIKFDKETALLLKEVRDLYISGLKMGNKDDMKEFFIASKAVLDVVGEKRILNAKKIVETQIEDIPSSQVNAGFNYIKSLAGWNIESE